MVGGGGGGGGGAAFVGEGEGVALTGSGEGECLAGEGEGVAVLEWVVTLGGSAPTFSAAAGDGIERTDEEGTAAEEMMVLLLLEGAAQRLTERLRGATWMGAGLASGAAMRAAMAWWPT